MRCSYCGFENADDSKMCIKCKAPLEKAKPQPSNPANKIAFFEHTVRDSIADISEKKEIIYGKTISDTPAPADTENLNDIEKDILIPCSKCGYLNPGDAIICAQCKSSLTTEEESNRGTEEQIKKETTISNTTTPFAGKKIFSGTIDPYKKVPQTAECSFTPILREGEQDGNIATSPAKHFAFESEPIQLNRKNLDEDNYTITSKVQAEVFCQNGKWIIVDKSDLQTTFIRVSSATELKDGDTVVMGDRKFIFSSANMQSKKETDE